MGCQKWWKVSFLTFLAQKASKVIIWIFSGFEDSSRKVRGSFFLEGGTQSWPGTAIVNHPLRLQPHRRLSYFPYIFYFVNFTISAAIRQGLFGSFENVIWDFGIFRIFWVFWVFFWSKLALGCSAISWFSGYLGAAVVVEWNVDVYRLVLEKLKLDLDDYFKSEWPGRRCEIWDLGVGWTYRTRDSGSKFPEMRGLACTYWFSAEVGIME